MLRHPRGKKWEPVYEPPEWIQQCLHCEKPRCDNCFYYTEKRREINRKQQKKFAERKKAERRRRREADREKEWREVERMLDAGYTISRILQTMQRGKGLIYRKHAARYSAYRARQERSKKQNGNADGNAESD